ncbi:MAG: AAA family ATPase [Alphaproteobacteria bacterium]|nr:AAA family ATPase [Alphaproteobacteria bacterium]
MKKLIIINGPMGIGKTAVCQELKHLITPCFYLDGDWAWMMEPFTVTEENKEMVIQNIRFLLQNYIENDFAQNVLFSWVIPQEEIFDLITDELTTDDFKVVKITLIASENSLIRRIEQDITLGRRKKECLEKSIAYLDNYKSMKTHKIMTDNKTPLQIAKEIKLFLDIN